MDNRITCIGMDVHKESIVVTAVSHDSDSATARFEIPNTDTGVHRLAKRLREMGEVRCVSREKPAGTPQVPRASSSPTYTPTYTQPGGTSTPTKILIKILCAYLYGPSKKRIIRCGRDTCMLFCVKFLYNNIRIYYQRITHLAIRSWFNVNKTKVVQYF